MALWSGVLKAVNALLYFVLGIATYVFGYEGVSIHWPEWASGSLLSVVAMISVFAGFEAWWGRTLGKEILGLRVARRGGARVPFLRALIRNLAIYSSFVAWALEGNPCCELSVDSYASLMGPTFLLPLPLAIASLAMLFCARPQAAYDRLLNLEVLRT